MFVDFMPFIYQHCGKPKEGVIVWIYLGSPNTSQHQLLARIEMRDVTPEYLNKKQIWAGLKFSDYPLPDAPHTIIQNPYPKCELAIWRTDMDTENALKGRLSDKYWLKERGLTLMQYERVIRGCTASAAGFCESCMGRSECEINAVGFNRDVKVTTKQEEKT